MSWCPTCNPICTRKRDVFCTVGPREISPGGDSYLATLKMNWAKVPSELTGSPLRKMSRDLPLGPGSGNDCPARERRADKPSSGGQAEKRTERKDHFKAGPRSSPRRRREPGSQVPTALLARPRAEMSSSIDVKTKARQTSPMRAPRAHGGRLTQGGTSPCMARTLSKRLASCGPKRATGLPVPEWREVQSAPRPQSLRSPGPC